MLFQTTNPILLKTYTKNENATITKIVCGNGHCLFLTSEFKLYGFGENEQGQLGIPLDTPNHKYINTVQEIQIPNLPNTSQIVDIAAGDYFSLVLIRNEDGRYQVIKFGINERDKYKTNLQKYNNVHIEQLPQDISNDVIDSIYAFGKRTAILVHKRREGDETNFSRIKLYIGNIDFANNYLPEYTLFADYDYSSVKIKSIGLGLFHMVVFLSELGKTKIYAVGDNTYGELGEESGNKLSLTSLTEITYEGIPSAYIKKIACGARHNLILCEQPNNIISGLVPVDGPQNILYAVGDNSEGQGFGYSSKNGQPIKVDININSNIIDCYCGYTHNIIILQNGDVMSWGQSSGGKLGYNEEHLTQGTPKVIMKLKQKSVVNACLGQQMTVIATGASRNENDEVLLSDSFANKIESS